VLVNRVYRTPQDAPEFSRGVPPWWDLQGCTRCVLFKNNHTVSHVMFFALAQCVNFSQILKSYLSENVNFLYFFACLFVMLVRWPSLDHESLFVSSVQPPFLGHLRIAWGTSGINCWNAAYLQFHRCPDAQLHLLALHCNSLLVAVQARKPLEIFKVALKVSRTF